MGGLPDGLLLAEIREGAAHSSAMLPANLQLGLVSTLLRIDTKHPITGRRPETCRRMPTTVQLPCERLSPHVSMNDKVSGAVGPEPHQPPDQG